MNISISKSFRKRFFKRKSKSLLFKKNFKGSFFFKSSLVSKRIKRVNIVHLKLFQSIKGSLR